MSQELYQLLHERSQIRIVGWPLGLVASLCFHGLVLAVVLYSPKSGAPVETTKTTWVSLPAMGGGGPAGGSSATEKGEEGERHRRVEEVAPKTPEKAGSATPNAFGSRPTKALKGTNPDLTSIGKAPVAAKSPNPVSGLVPGAAGSGNGQGVGIGSGFPGMKATNGVSGGTGMIGDIDSDFPFIWYLQQVQNRITGNWTRLSSAQGRVQIYFRIKRDGSLDAIRVEIPSGNPTIDQGALLAVKRSDPLPRLPDGFEGQTLGVRFWFTYLAN
ncbi:MAG TPA: energy transducer TonB [Holophaga sp.]|nr:energy transducer TonB [Holophaga sp.]HPS68962.1 energy transducer TonB [Holophaga sp.]